MRLARALHTHLPRLRLRRQSDNGPLLDLLKENTVLGHRNALSGPRHILDHGITQRWYAHTSCIAAGRRRGCPTTAACARASFTRAEACGLAADGPAWGARRHSARPRPGRPLFVDSVRAWMTRAPVVAAAADGSASARVAPHEGGGDLRERRPGRAA